MFLRLYLVGRFIMFHSAMVRDTASQSLGYLNQVSIDFVFVMKTYLERRPTRSLMAFSTVLFFIGSWSLRACDYQPGTHQIPFLDAMWLFIITFTTVGEC